MRRFIFVFAFVLMMVNVGLAQKQDVQTKESVLPPFRGPQIDLFTGSTTVNLSNDFVTALGSLQIAPDSVFPGRLRGLDAIFPITDGTLERDTLRGEILHSGGLTLTRGSTVVKLKSFIIDTTGEGIILTGLVSANGDVVGRIPLFDLQLSSSSFGFPRERGVFIDGVLVSLRPEAAGALNAVFETDAFVPGFNIGIAEVRGYGF